MKKYILATALILASIMVFVPISDESEASTVDDVVQLYPDHLPYDLEPPWYDGVIPWGHNIQVPYGEKYRIGNPKGFDSEGHEVTITDYIAWELVSGTATINPDVSRFYCLVYGSEADTTVSVLRAYLTNNPSVYYDYNISFVENPITGIEVDLSTDDYSGLPLGITSTFPVSVLPAGSNQTLNIFIPDLSSGNVDADISISNGTLSITPYNEFRTEFYIYSPVSSDSLRVGFKGYELPEYVDLDGPETVYIGSTTTYEAIVRPIEDETSGITWDISSGSSLVDYTEGEDSGYKTITIEALRTGTFTLTATSTYDPSLSESLTVEIIDIPVSSVDITGSNALNIGSSTTLTATALPTNATDRSVTWSVVSGGSNITYTTANTSTGGTMTITGNVAGSVTVRATAADGSGVSDTHTVTVLPVPVESIDIDGPTAVLTNESITITATTSPSNATDRSVTWSVVSGGSNITYTTANTSTGGTMTITGNVAGSVTVRATAADGFGATADYEIAITASTVPVSSITIDGPQTIGLYNSAILTATALPTDATDRSVVWSVVSGENIVALTPDTTGVGGRVSIEGLEEGTATVRATSVSNPTVHTDYTVTISAIKVNSITITGPSSIAVDETITIIAVTGPEGAANRHVEWSIIQGSSLVDAYTKYNTDTGGRFDIMPGSGGYITVRATAADGSGVSKDFTFESIANRVLVDEISITGPSSITVGTKKVIVATTEPIDATDRSVTWSIVDGASYISYTTTDTPSGGTMTITGKVAGSVTVRATSVDGNAEATYNIEIVESGGGGGTGPGGDTGGDSGKPSFSFNTVVGVIGQGFFDGSTSLAGLAIMAVLFFVMVAFLANVRAPVTYALVPMMLLAIMFAALGIVDTTVSFLIIIICAVLVALSARNLVGGRS